MENIYFGEQTKDAVEAAFEVLEELNALTYKPTLSIKDMEPNSLYKILKCKKVKTRYGERVLLELEYYQLYLPERFTKLSEKSLQAINEGGFCITNKGVDGKIYNIAFSKITDGSSAYLHF